MGTPEYSSVRRRSGQGNDFRRVRGIVFGERAGSIAAGKGNVPWGDRRERIILLYAGPARGDARRSGSEWPKVRAFNRSGFAGGAARDTSRQAVTRDAER